MRDYLISFFDEFDYPAAARAALLNCYDRCAGDAELCALTALYDECAEPDFRHGIMPRLNCVAERCGVHKYTLHLLYCVMLSRLLRKRYDEKGLDYGIFFDTMLDLKIKLTECEKMYGIEGTFVFWWFDGHFALRRFGLGRLQFELDRLRYAYRTDRFELPVGTKVINTHIPYGSPLKRELCTDAYDRAVAFFGNEFDVSAPVPFVCDSWLLHPVNSLLLGSDSNIVRFAGDFSLLSVKDDPKGGDLWRLYLKEYHGDPNEMPADTTLQRLYKKHLLEGGAVGTAYGIFLYSPTSVGA